MIFTILLLTAVADVRGDRADPPLEDERAFEGTWQIMAKSYGRPVMPPEGQDDQPLNKRWMIVKGGVWRMRHDGGPVFPMAVRRKAARPWPLIDRTEDLMTQPVPGALFVGGGGMVIRERGIYHLDGDKLTIVIGSSPKGLTPAPGRDVESWRRVSR